MKWRNFSLAFINWILNCWVGKFLALRLIQMKLLLFLLFICFVQRLWRQAINELLSMDINTCQNPINFFSNTTAFQETVKDTEEFSFMTLMHMIFKSLFAQNFNITEGTLVSTPLASPPMAAYLSYCTLVTTKLCRTCCLKWTNYPSRKFALSKPIGLLV